MQFKKRLRYVDLARFGALIFCLVFLFSGCALIHRAQNMSQFPFDISEFPNVDPNFNGKISLSSYGDNCYLVLNGVITADTPRAFRLAAKDMDARPCTNKYVILQSDGGNVKAAIQIGLAIRMRGFTTSSGIGMGASCSSSCGIAFIGGKERLMYRSFLLPSKIGFHQLAYSSSTGKKICVEPSSESSRLVFLYAHEMLQKDAANTFFEMAMGTDCNNIKKLSAGELIDIGIATGYGIGMETFFY